ncbi:hypothetical protein E2C01_100103 [Portunus trituberculatus]|uniref:Uncharacterized protein n=1 Tax=Portunus trituberculatus TaxID=210409 RepID=A0A5B7KCN5_PORTR|nr:hypothetical protein [Portunus trituberculatus]
MNLPRHCLMNSPRHCLMKPRYCPEVGFTRPHSTQAEVLSELPDFWKSVEVKASTSEQRLLDYRGIHITQHFTTATPHKYHFPSPRFFHIASI